MKRQKLSINALAAQLDMQQWRDERRARKKSLNNLLQRIYNRFITKIRQLKGNR